MLSPVFNFFSKHMLAVLLLAAFFILGSGFLLFSLLIKPASKPVFGVNFAKAQAEWLGPNWREAYLAILDDLGARDLRIPVNWNAVEPERGKFFFDDIDWMLAEAEKRNARVVLIVGRKLVRWPECHDPAWAHNLPREELKERVLVMLRAVMEHARTSRAVSAWQVENEPFFRFGECGKPMPMKFLKQEIALARSLDNRPIILTDSGELSTWLRTAPLSDALGISMYRRVWHKWFGYLTYPIPATYYSFHAWLVSPFVKRVIVTELQAEPWVTRDLHDVPIDEQYRALDVAEFRDVIKYARRTGFDTFYFWGAEWWYWLKTKGEPAFWEEAKKLWK